MQPASEDAIRGPVPVPTMRKILQKVAFRTVPGVSEAESSTNDTPKRKTTLPLDEPLLGLDEFLRGLGGTPSR